MTESVARASKIPPETGSAVAPDPDAGGSDAAREEPGRRSLPVPHPASDELLARVEKVERQNRWLRGAVVLVVVAIAALAYERVFPEGVVVRQTLLESKELKLLDSSGSPRLFLRMYSRVPVLQLMDHKGKPRLSLGLRFDDTPFIDLSDRTGQTRATLEMTGDETPALRLFDADGKIKFQIN